MYANFLIESMPQAASSTMALSDILVEKDRLWKGKEMECSVLIARESQITLHDLPLEDLLPYSLYMWQCCFCLSLHTLAMACRSVAGFQSMSYRTSLLAPTIFSPLPPALELSRNTLMYEWMLLNLSTMPYLVWGGVDPSSLQVEPRRSRVEVLRDTSTIYSWVELASSSSRQVTVASLRACSSQV